MFPISLKQTMNGEMGPNEIRMGHFNTTVSFLGMFSTVKTTNKKKPQVNYMIEH